MLDDDDNDDDVEVDRGREGEIASGATKTQEKPSPPVAAKTPNGADENETLIKNGNMEKNGIQKLKHFKTITSDNKDVDVDINVDVEVGGRNRSSNNSSTGNNRDHQNTITDSCRTLDGELATDEYAQDAQNYRILLAKIDGLLDKLRLDA